VERERSKKEENSLDENIGMQLDVATSMSNPCSTIVFATFIDRTGHSDSKGLLNLLRRKFGVLMDSLLVTKMHFLFDQGGFFMYCLDIVDEELMKPYVQLSVGRIQAFR
jgi:hypothetical protein